LPTPTARYRRRRLSGFVRDPAALSESRTFPDAPPARVLPSWFTTPIEFEKHESGLIEVVGGTVCPLDDSWTTFKQWKLDVGRGCGTSSSVSVITAGVVEFDPATRVGMTVARVVGVLRPVNIGTFNVFIMFPRDSADLTL
jgi:hypothetical protein